MNRLLLVIAVVGTVLTAASAGEVYDHFKQHPVGFTEDDLHLLADAFYIDSHYTEAQRAQLFNDVQTTLTNATTQTSDIGKLIDSTQGLIKVVKDAASQLTNPGNMISNTLKSGWAKMFGRLLQTADKASVAKFVDNLEFKVAEAKSQQNTITNALSNSNKFLGVLQGIGSLLGGRGFPLDKT